MPNDAPAFTPIDPNPYIVGTPVRDRTMFFGREAEFDLVRKRFAESRNGGLLVFCGERRSGKTSILFQILDRRLGPDFIPVLIDMQSMAVSNEIDFLDKVSREVLEALGPSSGAIAPPEFRDGSNHSGTFAEFIERVLQANPNRKLILLFDEYELFENKIASGALNEDVLYVLANLMEHQPVFLVFTGSQHLEARRADYWKILGKSQYKQISYLERSDAVHLIRRPVEGRLRYEDATVDRIVRLTSGQPFYTQAICQSLVDHANDSHEGVATPEALDGVVKLLVDNPLPQMIFLWDGLERDERLVLAVLAECLPDQTAHATVNDLMRSIRKRDYPLGLSSGQLSTALENLFQAELLLRRDVTDPPGYSFRMDLWRLWIRRKHSVWQAMRAEGLKIPRSRRLVSRRKAYIGVTVLALAAVVFMVPGWLRGRQPTAALPAPPGSGAAGTVPSPPGDGRVGTFTMQIEPLDAVVYHDGRRIGVGRFDDRIAAGTAHEFRITSPGYADSTFTVSVDQGGSKQANVALRPLLGDLTITTKPTGADVRVNGVRRGKSPLVLRGVPVGHGARIDASMAGYDAMESVVVLAEGKMTEFGLQLELSTVELVVSAEPPGAQLTVDHARKAVGATTIRGPAHSRHTVAAALDGYVSVETTVVLAERTEQLDLTLRRASPGVLVVLGDRPAQIYLNGSLIVENVQNSGPRELPPGTHQVHVVLVSGETIDQAVTVRPGERTVYDFSKNTVTRGAR